MGANSATGDVSVQRLPLAAGADAASLSERQMAQLRLLLTCDALWGGACVTVRGVGRKLQLAEGEGLDAGLLAELKAMGLVGSVSRERFTKMVTAYWLTRDGWRVLHPQPVEDEGTMIDPRPIPRAEPAIAQFERDLREHIAKEFCVPAELQEGDHPGRGLTPTLIERAHRPRAGGRDV